MENRPFSFSGILVRMKPIPFSFLVCYADENTPPKSIPPPRVVLPDDLAKLHASIQAFINATDAATRALGGANSGSVGVDRQLINSQLFQDINTLRAALKPIYAAQMEKLLEALQEQNLISMSNSRLIPKDPTWTTYLPYLEQGFNVSPPMQNKNILKPVIQSQTELRKVIDDARVTSRFVNQVIALADEAERRALTFLGLLKQANLLTVNNLEAIYRHGGNVVSAKPSEMSALLGVAAANTPPALLNTQFYQAATRIHPMVKKPVLSYITDVPRFNSGLGGNRGWGTRFYTGMPDYLRSTPVPLGIGLAPTYVQSPFITGSAPFFTPMTTLPAASSVMIPAR